MGRFALVSRNRHPVPPLVSTSSSARASISMRENISQLVVLRASSCRHNYPSSDLVRCVLCVCEASRASNPAGSRRIQKKMDEHVSACASSRPPLLALHRPRTSLQATLRTTRAPVLPAMAAVASPSTNALLAPRPALVKKDSVERVPQCWGHRGVRLHRLTESR